MLAKIKRSKSDLSVYKDKPLQGMPALKQKRSSQRIENLMLKMPTSPNHTGLNEFERTGISSNRPMSDMKYIGVQPDLNSQQACQNRTKPKKLSDSENNKQFRRELEVVIQQNGKPVVETNGLANKNTESTKNKKKKEKKEKEGKAHGLHSIKKQRRANRESTVSTSMRALTPRERESIMCLENVLSEHDDMLNVIEEEEENVFKSNPNSPASPWSRNEEKWEKNERSWEQNGSNLEDSDSSSVGSIIDLVGNLSDVRLSSSSSRPTSVNSNNNNYSRAYSSVIYEEVTSLQPPQQISAPPEFRDDVTTEDKVINEPIYSVVKKVKKSKLPTEPQKPIVTSQIEETFENQPTAKSSRQFWNQMNEKSDEKVPRREFNNAKPTKLPNSFVVRPKSYQNGNNIPSPTVDEASPVQEGLELDEFGNLPKKPQVFTVHGNQNVDRVASYDSCSISSSSGSDKSDIVAIPLQTISFNNNNNDNAKLPNKPFAVTSASKVMLWN